MTHVTNQVNTFPLRLPDSQLWKIPTGACPFLSKTAAVRSEVFSLCTISVQIVDRPPFYEL